MSEIDPHESFSKTQSSTPSATANGCRAWRLLIMFVSLFLGVRLFNLFVFANWKSTDTAIAIALGFVLPLVALLLIWRGKMAGYWILVTLFGLQVVGGVIIGITGLCRVGPLYLYVLGMKYLPTMTICFATATWLMLSPGLRLFIRSRNV